MNNFIKQLIESKFDFNIGNIELDDNDTQEDVKRISKSNYNNLSLSKSIEIANGYVDDLDTLTPSEYDYLKNNIDAIRKQVKESQYKVKSTKELKNIIRNRYGEVYGKNMILNLNDLDVSDIYDFTRLFDDMKECTINACLWDMKSAGKLNYIFSKCKKTVKIFADFWNLENVEDISGMFYNTKADIRIDLSTLTNKITTLRCTFYGCNVDKILKQAPYLDVSNVKDMYSTFKSTPFNYDISHWDVRKLKTFGDIFGDSKFNKDISNWRLDNFDIYRELYDWTKQEVTHENIVSLFRWYLYGRIYEKDKNGNYTGNYEIPNKSYPYSAIH